MDNQKELKEIERLKKYKFKEYTVDSFKKYWTYENDYGNKKARVVNAQYIAVYGLWHNRLISRLFYLEECMKYKKITRKVFEVQRQVAGMSLKLSCRLYNSTFAGFKVWTGSDREGWKTVNSTRYKCYRLVDNWSGEDVVGFKSYNDYRKYLLKSIHRYSAYELIPEDKQEYNCMFEYLLKYEKHPQLEMLVKMGMHKQLNNLSGIRWTKKGLNLLGITKEELPYLQSGMLLQEYRIIREWCLKYKFSVEEAKKALEFTKYKTYQITLEFSPRLIRYIVENKVSFNDYADLIRFKEDLGLPSENRYLYPSDFKSMHDDLQNRVTINKSEIQDKKIAEFSKELMKYSIEKDGFVIKPAQSTIELINEGKVLKHCVGSYASKMADKISAIMLIRKSDQINEPFVTLELKNKNIVQARAHDNGVPPENVQNFIRKWEKRFKLQGY